MEILEVAQPQELRGDLDCSCFSQTDMWMGKRWNLCKLLTWPRKGANTARVDRCQLQFTFTSWIQSSCIIFRTLVIFSMALQRSSASFSTSVWVLDLRDFGPNFWSMWAGASTPRCTSHEGHQWLSPSRWQSSMWLH